MTETDEDEDDDGSENGANEESWQDVIRSYRSKIKMTYQSIHTYLSTIKISYLFKFAFALLLIVSIIALVGILAQGQISQTLEEDTEQQLVLEAEAEASQLSEFLTSFEMPARVLSSDPRLAGNRSVKTAYLDKQMNTGLSDRITAVHVVDTQRERIISSTDRRDINRSVSHTPWINQTAFSGYSEVITSEPYRNSHGAIVLAFMSPVVEERGQVLVVTVDATRVSFDRAIEGTFTEVVRPVLGEEKTRVLFSDSPHRETILSPYIEGRSQRDIPELREALGGNKGFRTNGTISTTVDRKYVTSYAPVESENDWIVIKHAPKANAYQLRTEIRQALLLFLVLGLLGVLIVGGTLGRNTTVAIRDLSRRATEIERGNFDITVSSNRRDEIGQLYDSIESMRDSLKTHIDDLKRSRQEAEELNEQLQVLDRLLRHNLNNEMNTIILHAESIQIEGSEPISNYAEKILDKCNELLETTEKQREITKSLASGRERTEIDVQSILADAADTVREEYPSASITLELSGQSRILVLDKFEQAVLELLENAIEHNDRAPEIEVKAVEENGVCKISISDNGPSIPQTDQDILTGRQEISSLNHGSGIGLWLVFWIVRRSEGKIEYEENEPRGNTLTLVIPTAEA